jgi:citrate lyase subunit beta/citryl-CoA lyase
MAYEPSRSSLAAGSAATVTARSYLYVPGDQAHKLQHALGSGADAIIADLEDAVATSSKVDARRVVAHWLATELDGDQPELWVRVNPSPRRLTEDVHAVVAPAVAGICLPKTHAPEQVRDLGELLAAAEQRVGLAAGSIKVVALLESAAGLLSARAIAEQPRVWQVGLGELDLCAEVGIQPSADERELLPIRVQVVLASAAAGLAPPIGPVSTDFRDLVALRQSTDALRRVGFGSRWAIHPAQVPIINQAFTPSPEEEEAARRLVELYDGALDRGVGVVVDEGGQMVDEAVVRAARRTLARARPAAEKLGAHRRQGR